MSGFTPLRVNPQPAQPLAVSHTETDAPKREQVWQTVPVTSGRIIIGWRVGT
jgi:hypothetical protein